MLSNARGVRPMDIPKCICTSQYNPSNVADNMTQKFCKKPKDTAVKCVLCQGIHPDNTQMIMPAKLNRDLLTSRNQYTGANRQRQTHTTNTPQHTQIVHTPLLNTNTTPVSYTHLDVYKRQ